MQHYQIGSAYNHLLITGDETFKDYDVRYFSEQDYTEFAFYRHLDVMDIVKHGKRDEMKGMTQC